MLLIYLLLRGGLATCPEVSQPYTPGYVCDLEGGVATFDMDGQHNLTFTDYTFLGGQVEIVQEQCPPTSDLWLVLDNVTFVGTQLTIKIDCGHFVEIDGLSSNESVSLSISDLASLETASTPSLSLGKVEVKGGGTPWAIADNNGTGEMPSLRFGIMSATGTTQALALTGYWDLQDQESSDVSGFTITSDSPFVRLTLGGNIARAVPLDIQVDLVDAFGNLVNPSLQNEEYTVLLRSPLFGWTCSSDGSGGCATDLQAVIPSGSVSANVTVLQPDTLLYPEYPIEWSEQDGKLPSGSEVYPSGIFCYPGEAAEDGSCKACNPTTYSLAPMSAHCLSCPEGAICEGFSQDQAEYWRPSPDSSLQDWECDNAYLSENRDECELVDWMWKGQVLRVESQHMYIPYTDCPTCTVYDNTTVVYADKTVWQVFEYQNWQFNAYECPYGYCCESADGCPITKGFPLIDTSELSPAAADILLPVCVEGRNNSIPFCGKCNDGLFETFGDGAKCRSDCVGWDDVNPLLFVVGGLVGLLLLGLLLRSEHDGNDCTVVFAKILLNFYQLAVLITFQSVKDIVKPIFDIFMFQFYELECSFVKMTEVVFDAEHDDHDCTVCVWPKMDAKQKIWMTLSFPFGLVAMLFVMFLLYTSLRCCVKNRGLLPRASFVGASWTLFFICYTILLVACADLVTCRPVEVIQGIVEHRLFLAGDEECETTERTIIILVLGCMFLVPFGIVLVLGRIRRSTDISALRHRISYRVFTKAFTDQYWWYQAVLLLRRLAVVGAWGFLSEEDNKRFAYVALFTTFFLAHIKMQPFRSEIENLWETLCLFVLMWVSLINAWWETAKDHHGEYEDEFKYFTALLVLVPGVLVIPYLLWQFPKTCRGEGKVVKVDFKKGPLGFTFMWDRVEKAVVVARVSLPEEAGVKPGMLIKSICGQETGYGGVNAKPKFLRDYYSSLGFWESDGDFGSLTVVKQMSFVFAEPQFYPGQRVEALYTGLWFAAVLLRINGDGTYKVVFDEVDQNDDDMEAKKRKLKMVADGIREIRRAGTTDPNSPSVRQMTGGGFAGAKQTMAPPRIQLGTVDAQPSVEVQDPEDPKNLL